MVLLDPRLLLNAYAPSAGEDFAGLSRMLGRNAAYIQQYVRRGVPRRLKEEERRKLARYFAVSGVATGRAAGETGAATAWSRQTPSGDGFGRSRRDRVRGAGAGLFRFRRKLAEGAHRDPAGKVVDRPGRRRFHGADAESRGTISWSISAMPPTAYATGFTCFGSTTRWSSSGSRFIRWAGRLTVQSDNPAYPDWPNFRHRRDQLHRPRDLGGPRGRLTVSAGGRSATAAPPARRRSPVPIRTPFIGLPIAIPPAKPARMQKVRKHPPAWVVRVFIAATPQPIAKI